MSAFFIEAHCDDCKKSLSIVGILFPVTCDEDGDKKKNRFICSTCQGARPGPIDVSEKTFEDKASQLSLAL